MDAVQLSGRQKALALAGVLLGMLLAALDNTIVATAGPTMQQDLGIEAGLYVWITLAYLVASTVLVPIWGKLSDSLGRRRVLLAGIGLFLLGSALCGISQNATQLILFRAVQGLGSASVFTSAFAIVGDLYSPRERGRLNGFFGAVFGLSSVVGPLVGGFITDNFGWHWCFFVNLPVGAVAIAFILARMPPLLPREQKPFRLDALGAITLAIGVVPLLIALSLGKAQVRAGETGFLWTSWQELTLFGVGVVGIIAFILVERCAKDPIVDLKLFQNRPYARGSFAAFMAGLPFLCPIVFLPLFMQNVVGERATGAGLTTLPLTFGIVFSNIAAGQATTRTGKYKPFIVGSLVLLAAAFAILAFTLTTAETKASASWKMFLVGLGIGPAIPLFALAIQNAVAPQLVGVASSMATFARQMGGVIGIAIAGTVFATSLSGEIEARVNEATKDVPAAFRDQFKGPAPSTEEGAPQSQGFDRAAVEQRVHDAFAEQRKTVEAALHGDPGSIDKLKNDPRTDARMKEMLEAGGPGALVAARMNATLAKIKAAFDAGPDAVQALASDAEVPPPIAERLKGVPAPALASPEARAQILEGIERAMQQNAERAREQVIAAALQNVDKALHDAEASAVDTVGKVDRALKEAFTIAVQRVYIVAIVMTVLALLASLIVPALPLRQQAAWARRTESDMTSRRAFSVSTFARDRAGRVLLIKHKRLGTWLPVGGEVEAGETPLEAAQRELREETGLEGRFTAVSGVDGTPPGFLAYEEHQAGSKGLHMNFCFTADVDGDPAPHDEWTEFRWVTSTEGIECPANVAEIVRALRGGPGVARAWLRAFNAQDLDALLSLYGDDAVHTSPKLRDRRPETKGEIRGKLALRAWWADAFARLPELKYEEIAVTSTGERVFLEYTRRVPGEPDLVVAELFIVREGLIRESRVFHG